MDTGLRRWSVRLVALTLAAMLWPTGHAAAQDESFIGVVEEDNVEVRAGAGRAYYLVGTLRKGQRVQVDKIIFGWPQIAAPEGTYSYVSKAFVDAKGDGKTGVVNADRTGVRAAATTGPVDSYRQQVYLSRGDEVQIVGEEQGFYKIAPPANAFVYVAPGAIRRATAAELGPTEAVTPTVTPPAPDTRTTTPPTPDQSIEQMIQQSRSTPTPTPTPTPPDTTAPDVAAPDTDTPTAQIPPITDTPATQTPTQRADTAPKGFEIEAVSDRVKQLDGRMKASLDLPLEDQPTDELLAAYREAQLDPQLPPLDREIVKFRIATLQRNKALADGLRQLRDAKDSVAAAREVERDPQEMAGPVTYAAVGQLLASSVYDGVNLPRMYRIVAPGGGRTLAYIQPDDVINATARLGRIVGVVGPMRFDPGLKANVIEARRIDVLEKSSPTDAPGTAPGSSAAPAIDLDLPVASPAPDPAIQPVEAEPDLDAALDPAK
jgi:hypothetical protein